MNVQQKGNIPRQMNTLMNIVNTKFYKEGAQHPGWARQYCKGKFGWHFDKNNNAVVSFEKEQDASFWCLRWIDEYNKRNI